MRISQNSSKRLLSLLCAISVSLIVIAPVGAMDTDVYLMSPTVARDDSPNVMIILDNSGSMDTVISKTRPAYDPAIDYCTGDLDTLTGISGANAGKPSNCSTISGRIYWSFTSSPPSNSSSDWFASSKNKCIDSTSALANSGFYGSTKIAHWRSGNGWKSLSGVSDSSITYVDCQADGTTNGQSAGDNTFPRNSTSNAYTSISGQAFNWANFNSNATPTLYSSNYLNYWNNPNLLITKTRLSVAKDAVKSIIDANKSIRFGLTVFNYNGSTPHGGRVIMRIDTMSDARRAAMKNLVDGLTASTWTPLAETMWEAYRYFGGLAVTYGNPSPAQEPQQDSCAQNTSSSYCDNGALYRATTGEYSDSSGTIRSGAPVDAAYNDGTYVSPFKYGCQTAYIIYVTDGDPTNDSNANSAIASLTGTPCDGSSCLDDLAGWMHNNDVYSGLPGKQVVNTYTIGFGGGISASGLALLQQTASKGGGTYYTADDADQLSSALQGAITEILQANSSFTAPSLSVNAFNKLYNRDDIYFALFKPSASQAWDGNIKKYKLCNGADVAAYGCTYGDVIDVNNAPAIDTQTSKIKTTAVSYWGTTADGAEVTQGGAGAQITQSSKVPRALYTYRGSYSGLSAQSPATPVAVVAATGNPIYDAAAANPTILGLPSSATATDVAKLINWMRGQDVYDTNANGNTTEARPWNFADPLHSRPVAFTYGCVGGGPCTSSSNPIIKLFVGTNDGMIRIINGSTGEEEWAFIPNEMLASQYALSQDADGKHLYGMDDSPAFLVNDINNDGVIDPAAGDKVYMYIGMRRGGRNLYAFDVTPAAKMAAQTDKVTPKLIWVIQGGAGDFTRLGQTWSQPVVARIRAKCTSSVCDDGNPATNDSESRMVLIFGGGYDINEDNAIPAGTDSMGNAIYIVDPFTGSRIWWASSDASASLVLPNMQYAIPSAISAIDTNGDKSVDRLYVGDLGGQVWRIDLGDQIASNSNGGSTGYVFADVGCTGGTRMSCSATTNQNRRKFFYPPDVAAANDPNYSTSQFYDLVTIASGDREDPLDLLTTNQNPVQEAVHNRIYAFRDYNYKTGAPATIPSPITEAVMYNATADNLGTLTGTALQNEIDTFVKGSKGWYIDLKEASPITLTNGLTTRWIGEKSLAKTVIYAGTLYVTTFIPANDSTAQTTCQANEGLGRYYALNYLTGSAAFDLNHDNNITAADRFAVAGGGIPSEVIIVIRDPGNTPVAPPPGSGGGSNCNGGVTAMVGTSGGSSGAAVNSCLQRYRIYWYDE
jgi:type IV pilus assembly protein PilY1